MVTASFENRTADEGACADGPSDDLIQCRRVKLLKWIFFFPFLPHLPASKQEGGGEAVKASRERLQRKS